MAVADVHLSICTDTELLRNQLTDISRSWYELLYICDNRKNDILLLCLITKMKMKTHRLEFRVKSNSGEFCEHDLDRNNIKVTVP